MTMHGYISKQMSTPHTKQSALRVMRRLNLESMILMGGVYTARITQLSFSWCYKVSFVEKRMSSMHPYTTSNRAVARFAVRLIDSTLQSTL